MKLDPYFQWHFAARKIFNFVYFFLLVVPSQAQQNPNEDVIQGIDASVLSRDQGIAMYTVNEHYAVFRGQDDKNPAAEMVVKTTYKKDLGKSYSVQSETGSEIPRKMLELVLDSEKRLSEPSNRVTAIITTANYEMSVKGGEVIEGRNCVVVALTPRRNSPYLFNGTIWVDALDKSIVRLDGIASKSPSVLAGPSQVFRQYAPVNGFPMATHAKAISKSWVLGQTVIRIDYSDYQIQPSSPQ